MSCLCQRAFINNQNLKGYNLFSINEPKGICKNKSILVLNIDLIKKLHELPCVKQYLDYFINKASITSVHHVYLVTCTCIDHILS